MQQQLQTCTAEKEGLQQILQTCIAEKNSLEQQRLEKEAQLTRALQILREQTQVRIDKVVCCLKCYCFSLQSGSRVKNSGQQKLQSQETMKMETEPVGALETNTPR